jgi:tRNA threonylcarbamoyladenosine modification (KEOPS) complex  Pcc1 subunit
MIGDRDLGEVVIEVKARDVALFQANMGRIANLTFES